MSDYSYNLSIMKFHNQNLKNDLLSFFTNELNCILIDIKHSTSILPYAFSYSDKDSICNFEAYENDTYHTSKDIQIEKYNFIIKDIEFFNIDKDDEYIMTNMDYEINLKNYSTFNYYIFKEKQSNYSFFFQCINYNRFFFIAEYFDSILLKSDFDHNTESIYLKKIKDILDPFYFLNYDYLEESGLDSQILFELINMLINPNRG